VIVRELWSICVSQDLSGWARNSPCWVGWVVPPMLNQRGPSWTQVALGSPINEQSQEIHQRKGTNGSKMSNRKTHTGEEKWALEPVRSESEPCLLLSLAEWLGKSCNDS
jgi:hypothetical protein